MPNALHHLGADGYAAGMPFDLAPLLSPRECGILVFECQDGVIGEQGVIPGLAAAVRESRMLDTLAHFLEGARAAGARVFYCCVEKRIDGVGNPRNTPLEIRMQAKAGEVGVPQMGAVCAEIAPQDGDVVITREHGMTGFYESGLDAYLRNTGVKTVIPTGVSVNVGILGTSLEAVNRGYTVVVPTDCVAGDPPEYAEQCLRYSVRNVAFLSTSEEIHGAWKTHAG